MKTQRLLQISMAALVPLATLLRTLGSRDAHMLLLALLAAAVSIYVTDIKGWIRLPRIVANTAALLAVALSLRGFFALESELQLMAIGNILTYLQLVLLFEQKHPRLYWQLLMLGLLQVVVGAAVNVSVIFGLLLVLYMFAAILTMTLFFAYREEPRQRKPAIKPRGVTAGDLTPVGPARWPLPLAGAALQPASKRGAHWSPGWAAFRQAGWIGASTLLFTAMLFVVTPRIGESNWSQVAGVVQPVTGFAPTVKLSDVGPEAQNAQAVMRIRFLNEAGASIELVRSPLLRGSLLNQYAHGEWSFRSGQRRSMDVRRGLPTAKTAQGVVRQQIDVEPMSEEILFAVYPPVLDNQDGSIAFSSDLQLHRTGERMSRAMSFALGTTSIRNQEQWPLVPVMEMRADAPDRYVTTESLSNQEPAEVKRIADEVLAGANVAADDRMAVAKTLLAFLRESGQFEYAVARQPRNRQLDPIVDFLEHNRRGHCEFFASALCLMLRSQGIPARLVVGYTADWNPLTEDYQVRQLHAHAWVEAHLEERQILAELRYPGADFTRGAWLTLDPTPAAATEAAARRGIFAPVGDAVDYAQSLWNKYVLGLTTQRQRELIYDPVMTSLETWTRDAGAWMTQRFSTFWGWLQAGWLGWRGALTLAVAGFIYYSCARTLRIFRRWMASRRQAAPVHKNGKPRVATIDFYRRLEELLARRGFVRAAGETPREFAVSIAPQLATAGGGGLAATLPRQIVDAFYRVRFGARDLDNHQRQAVEQALRDLDRALRESRQQPSPRKVNCRALQTPVNRTLTMKIGLVGYQGAGKSTLFEWLTGVPADPALAHTMQMAMAPVPDPRVEPLCKVYLPKKVTIAALEIVDTPGLSRSHEGNPARLALIREAGCLLLVVAAFGGRDPLADLAAFDEDFLLADMEIVGGRIERLRESLKKPRARADREHDEEELLHLEPLLATLESGKPLHETGLTDEQLKFTRSFRLLTEKPRMVVVNLADDDTDPARFAQRSTASVPVAAIPLGLEVELARMSPTDRADFQKEMGLEIADRDSVLRQILNASGQMLYFTAGDKEVRTWMLPKGGTALEAADNIHSDLARGFIRAEVMQCDDLIRLGSEREIKANHLMRQEPKDYVVRDGDILHIRFSV